MNITGRRFYSHTECNLSEDGFWTVHNVMGEGRKEPDTDWEDEILESTAVDRVFENAYALAMESVLKEFTDLTLKKGLTSLFDVKKVVEDEPKDKGN